MDKQDSPSDSADSSSSWEFVLESNTENAESTKNSTAPSSRSSESDGIIILSDCEDFERCEDVVEMAEECTDDLLFSSNNKTTSLVSKNDSSPNDPLELIKREDLNQVATPNEHVASEEINSSIICKGCDHMNFSYLTSVSIALILALSVFLSPLNSIFLQYFHKNDTFDEGDFGNGFSANECPPISKYCLTQYISNERDTGRLIINPSDENNFKLKIDVTSTPEKIMEKNNGRAKITKNRSKNRKRKHSKESIDSSESEEQQKNPSKGKNVLNIDETVQLNEIDYKRFVARLKKKQEKLNSKAKYFKKKEKYLEAKEQELLKLEEELHKKSALINELLKKEDNRRRHFNNKDDDNNNNKNSFKSKYHKESPKEEKMRIKRRDVNNTVSGDWYDQLYNAREKIRKDEHASDWLFESYNYRETKRKESKRKNKSPWMGGGVNYRSNFRR